MRVEATPLMTVETTPPSKGEAIPLITVMSLHRK